MKFRWLILAVIILYGVFPASVGAQTGQPLIAMSDGDLWLWGGGDALEQITDYGYNGPAAVSMNGNYAAYYSAASQAVDAQNAGTLPGNIWLMEVRNRGFTRIAEQPANFAAQAYSTHRFRGNPVFSPNSDAVAWVEVDGETFASRIMVYDINTGSTRVFANGVDLGFQDGGLVVPEIQWGAGGMTRINSTFRGNHLTNILEVYATNGTMRTFEVGSSATTLTFQHVWLRSDAGPQHIGLLDNNGNWSTLNVSSGERRPLASPPVRQLTFGVKQFALQPHTEQTGDSYQLRWHLINGNFDQGPIGYTSRDLIYEAPVLSPNGSQMAINNRGEVRFGATAGSEWATLKRAPGQQPFRPVGRGIAWASMYWSTDLLVNPVPTPTQPPVNPPTTVCNLTPRLAIGAMARVMPGVPNNLRAAPTVNSADTGNLPAGTIFEVLQGPICADGYLWYEIRGTEFIGWTAEGTSNGSYFLEPATCGNSPFTRLTPGGRGEVLPGTPNTLREGPGTNYARRGSLAGGTSFVVEAGPHCGPNGRAWYAVRSGNVSGWTAEGEGSEYWLQPR